MPKPLLIKLLKIKGFPATPLVKASSSPHSWDKSDLLPLPVLHPTPTLWLLLSPQHHRGSFQTDETKTACVFEEYLPTEFNENR